MPEAPGEVTRSGRSGGAGRELRRREKRVMPYRLQSRCKREIQPLAGESPRPRPRFAVLPSAGARRTPARAVSMDRQIPDGRRRPTLAGTWDHGAA